MKKILSLISLLMLTIAATAQTLTITEGKVTYQYPASLTGDMTFDNGTMLTILGKSFTLADVSISVSSENAADESIVIKESGEGGTIELGFPSSLSLEVQVQPEDALSWIGVKSVVALQNMQTIELLLKPNASVLRSATVIVKSKDETFGLTYLINQNVDEQLVADKAAFAEYKVEQKAAADALAMEGDSEACQTLINNAKASIDALEYDETKTLEENKAVIDAIIATLAESLTAQRENDVWANGTIPPNDEIWYVTSDNKTVRGVWEGCFDKNIISNTYTEGKGVIKLSGALKTVKQSAFLNAANLKVLYLPDCVEEFEDHILPIDKEFDSFYIPKSLSVFSGKSFSYSVIRSFVGDERIKDNGTMIVIDGHIRVIASPKTNSMTISGDYDTIDEFAMWMPHPELENLFIEEGVSHIGAYAFSGCRSLKTAHLPQTLTTPSHSMFNFCDEIVKFEGPSEYVSPDGRTIYRNVPVYNGNGTFADNLKFIAYIAKGGLTDYTVEEDVQGLDPESFCRAKDLRTITFTSPDIYISSNTFDECYNLEQIKGPGASEDGRCLYGKGSAINCQYEDVKLLVFAGKGIENYTIDSYCKEVGNGVFAYWKDLKSVEIPDDVYRIGHDAFRGCSNLKAITLSATLQYIGNDAFCDCNGLQTVYMRAPFPSSLTNFTDNPSASIGISDDMSDLAIYVPENSVELYKTSSLWSRYASHIKGIHFDYDFYVSSDYSNDGRIKQLQVASHGAGINVVFMGDAFSDRQVENGTYESIMRNAMNALFSEEPYRSMKDCFNVYSVDVVSSTEGYQHGEQILNTGHGEGTHVFGNDEKVIEYAVSAIGENAMDDALIIVMMNEDAYAGTCYMYNPPSGNYGRGLSIAYFPTSSDTDTFNGLVSHEAGGHGFAKLADEYAYEYMGAISADEITNTKVAEPYGWYKNVDFTSDPAQVKWSQFLSDSRYANEGLGCFEGGLTYWSGVWRPTDASIMRYNTGGFNAPSRYAIWYRIGKLAYGESWEGSYEDFVAYDVINRTQAAEVRRKAQIRHALQKPLPQLPPPVVIGHSWRDILQKTK